MHLFAPDLMHAPRNRLILDSTPFSLREVIFEALTSLAFGAGKKNLEVFLDIDPAVPDVVVGDGSRLAQVVKNLVGVSVESSGTESYVAESDICRTRKSSRK